MKLYRYFLLIVLLSVAAFGQIDARTQVKNLPAALAGTQPWAAGTFYEGIPATNKKVVKFIVPTWSPALTITIPANCSGSVIVGESAAAANTTYTVAKNGSTICTGTVAVGGTAATWTGTGSATTLTTGDVLTVQQGAADSTFGNVSVSIAGKR